MVGRLGRGRVLPRDPALRQAPRGRRGTALRLLGERHAADYRTPARVPADLRFGRFGTVTAGSPGPTLRVAVPILTRIERFPGARVELGVIGAYLTTIDRRGDAAGWHFPGLPTSVPRPSLRCSTVDRPQLSRGVGDARHRVDAEDAVADATLRAWQHVRHCGSRPGLTPGSAGSWSTSAGIGCASAATGRPSWASIRRVRSTHSRNPSSARRCSRRSRRSRPSIGWSRLDYLEGMTVEQIAEHVGRGGHGQVPPALRRCRAARRL